MHALPDGRLLLAFSGGPDSVGLAARLRDRRPLLAYVDHRLRGSRAGRAERLRVKTHAAALGLPLVRARVALDSGSEAVARRARYDALHALAAKHGCCALVTAHTADDRAETIWLNLQRGAGLRGIAALKPDACFDGLARLRPALDERRATLHDAARVFLPVHDRTNRATRYARARARALGLPALALRLGEDPVPLLCALGDLAAALRAALEDRAAGLRDAATRHTLLDECGASFPYLVEALRGAGPPLTRNAYASLRDFLRAGRTGRTHVTPGGDAWTLRRGGGVEVES